jgi:hypothetical protein
VYWVDTPSGHRCTRHNKEFERGEVCYDCAAEPADPADAPIAEYDRKLAARIEEYKATARTLKRVGLELCENEGRDVTTGVKAIAESTKLFRLAEERQEVLDNREHELRLIKHEREMSGLRGSS